MLYFMLYMHIIMLRFMLYMHIIMLCMILYTQHPENSALSLWNAKAQN